MHVEHRASLNTAVLGQLSRQAAVQLLPPRKDNWGFCTTLVNDHVRQQVCPSWQNLCLLGAAVVVIIIGTQTQTHTQYGSVPQAATTLPPKTWSVAHTHTPSTQVSSGTPAVVNGNNPHARHSYAQ